MTDITTGAYELAHAPSRVAVAEQNIIMCAWLTAFVLPIVGFALGVILTVRQREGHGIATMAVSVVAPFAWYFFVVAINSLSQY